jgi:restriction system protein
MLQNPDSPWNPPEPATITPLEFELQVLEWLKRAPGPNGRYEFDYQGAVMGTGAVYKIDLLMRLAGFSGAEITILVECTHQKRAVERHEISILAGRLRDTGAHKGMLFSTGGFQKGALSYAADNGIATITVLDRQCLYETESIRGKTVPPQWIKHPRFAGQRVSSTESGLSFHAIDDEHVDALRDFLDLNRAT